MRSSFIKDGEKNPKKGLGFLSDTRRMNVSLSRSRLCLIVIGDIHKLRSRKEWRNLVEYSINIGNCFKAFAE